MNYPIAIVVAAFTGGVFGLIAPEEYLFLVWFIYLITFFGVLLYMKLEDIEDGIRNKLL